MAAERCFTIYDEAGEPLGVVRAEQPPDEDLQAVFRELIAAVREQARQNDPDDLIGKKQRERIARVRQRAGLSGEATE